MKKTLFFVLAFIMIAFTVSGCATSNNQTSDSSNPVHEPIDKYIYPEYQKFNSPAKENGLGNTSVYLDGTITDIFQLNSLTMVTLNDSDNEWSIGLGDDSLYSKYKSFLLNKPVRVFGIYRGLSAKTNLPTILAEKIIVENKTYYFNESANEESSNSATEAITENPTTQITDSLKELYNDDRITLSFYQMHEYKYDPDETRIEFYVENKTDKQLTIQSDIVSVNGISYDGNMSEKVLPNTKRVIEMNVYQKIPVESPSSFGITINYFDGTLGDTINEHGIVIPEVKIN